MRASIIIPTWNGLRWIGDCLRAIDDDQLHEIIVVDNGSHDGTPDLVAHEFPHVQLIRLPYNKGFAAAINSGLKVAHSHNLILLNQDVVVRVDCIPMLLQRLVQNGPAIVGCKLLYPDGKTIQHAGGVIDYPRADPHHHGYRQFDDGRWDELREVDYVTGAVFAFDRAVLDAVGSFDEAFYPAYYEEVDYCFRARAAGFAVWYEPSAVAIHYETQSSDRRGIVYHRAMQRGRLRFVLKHRSVAEICEAFEAAERAYLLNAPIAYRRQVLSRAYGHALLNLPAKSERGALDDAVTLRVIETLSRLQQAAINGTSGQEGNKMNDQSQPTRLPLLEEFQFQSHVPIVGSLISAVRRGLYGLASRWAVRYLMQQQNEINRKLLQTVRDYTDRLEEYDARLVDQDRDLVYLTRTVAELELRQRHMLKRMPSLHTNGEH